MRNRLKKANRRLVYRLAAAHLFGRSKSGQAAIGIRDGRPAWLIAAAHGVVNEAIAHADGIAERNIRRSILEPSRPVMHLAIAVLAAALRWPDGQHKPLIAEPVQTLLLASPTWLHQTVNFAARIAATWPAVQQVAPPLMNTDEQQLVKLRVPADWPTTD